MSGDMKLEAKLTVAYIFGIHGGAYEELLTSAYAIEEEYKVSIRFRNKQRSNESPLFILGMEFGEHFYVEVKGDNREALMASVLDLLENCEESRKSSGRFGIDGAAEIID